MSTRVAVVTGANKGIGFAIVRGLCKVFKGDVFLTARDEGRGKKAVAELEKEGLRPKFHQLDIDDHASIVRLRNFLQQNYQGLDVLVNNAAIAYEFNDTKGESFAAEAEEVCRVNYFGTQDVCQVLFPILRPHARVSTLSSINCQISFAVYSEELKERIRNPNITLEEVDALVRQFVDAASKNQHKQQGFDNSPYGMSKVGVCLLTALQQKMLDDQGKEDIIVNCCDPGPWIATDMSGQYGAPIDEGAETPLYCALLPPNVKSPKGKFIVDKKISNWT